MGRINDEFNKQRNELFSKSVVEINAKTPQCETCGEKKYLIQKWEGFDLYLGLSCSCGGADMLLRKSQTQLELDGYFSMLDELDALI